MSGDNCLVRFPPSLEWFSGGLRGWREHLREWRISSCRTVCPIAVPFVAVDSHRIGSNANPDPGCVSGAVHTHWVRITHAIVSAAVFVLVFTGAEILMVHPRLYWGEAGNDLTPTLVELPISRNYKHGGWDQKDTFANGSHPVVSAARTYDIFNQNGWGRSLHFLAGWCLVAAGALYLFSGLITGHFLRNMLPRRAEQSFGAVWADVKSHLRGRIPPTTGGPHYGLLQKCAYVAVIFSAQIPRGGRRGPRRDAVVQLHKDKNSTSTDIREYSADG